MTDGGARRGPQPWRGRKRLSTKLRKPVRLGDFVVPAAVTWTVSGTLGDPDLRAEFEVRNGRPECIEVHLIAKRDGRALRSSDLTAVEIEQAVTGVFTSMAYDRVSDHEAVSSEGRSERAAWRLLGQVEAAAKVVPGPPPAELQRVAEIYLEHADNRPLKMLEAILGYSTRTAARRAKQARDQGLLPPTKPRNRKA